VHVWDYGWSLYARTIDRLNREAELREAEARASRV
jgi:hypothetical protein